MTREKIKFAGRYVKLHGQTSAQLLAVLTIVLEEDSGRHANLIGYDTIREDGTRYQLAPGCYLLLLFLGNDLIPFTTLRRYTPKKNEYYKRLVGDTLDIEITEEAK